MFKSVAKTFLALGACLPLTMAAAASEVCDGLQAQLTSLSETYSAPVVVRKYARAIAEQKMNMRALRVQLRDNSCSGGSVIVIGGDNAEECARLEEKMSRMQRNLEILNSKRLSLITGETAASQRLSLLTRLEENGCNEQPILASAEPATAESLVSDLPGGLETIRVPTNETANYDRSQFVDLGGVANNGTFRTMCVRTCDGGYFPISSSASSMSFRRDAQVCSMMCPGVETELYYHSINQESADMRSTVTGQSYEALPNAYSFRTRPVSEKSECGCNFSLYYKEMMKRDAFVNKKDEAPAKQSAITWVKPELRGQLSASETKRSKATVRDYTPDARIRRIGPTFLPDEKAIERMAKIKTADNESANSAN